MTASGMQRPACIGAVIIRNKSDSPLEAVYSLTFENIKGIYSPSLEEVSFVESEADFNWDVDKLVMNIQDATIQVKLPINKEDVTFSLKMYPSNLGDECQNRMIGIADKSSKDYKIIRFIIEKDAGYMYLFQPNLKWLKETIVNLGVQNTKTGEIYVTQFTAPDFDYDTMYSNLPTGDYTDHGLANQELNYMMLKEMYPPY